MTREHKLALIVGFALILVVGVFVSDHFSKARLAKPGDQLASSAGMPRDRQNQPVVYPQADPVVQLVSNPAPAAPQHEAGTWENGQRPTLDGGMAADVNAAARGPGLAGAGGVNPMRDLPAAAGPIVNVQSEMGAVVPLPGAQPRDTRGADGASSKPSTMALPVSTGELRRHTVARGDSLAKVAKKYYGDDKLWRRLAEYNRSRVGDNASVNLGVTLLVPPRDVLMGQATLAPEGSRVAPTPIPGAGRKTEVAKADAGKPATKPGAKPETKKPAERSYTVKSGDTLALIAERELGSGRRWREIQKLNVGVLGEEDTITVGMVLKLPAKS